MNHKKRFLIILSFSLLFLTLNVKVSRARAPIPVAQLEQLSGIRLQNEKPGHWDRIYSRPNFVYGKAPIKFLSENYHFIPYGSSVLDLGMGEGRNAVFLAQKGYRVTGIDISTVAVQKANQLAKEFNVNLNSIVASAKKYQVMNGSYDAIICIHYFDRELLEKIKNWLKPGGILIIETFTEEQLVKDKKHELEASFTVKTQELLRLFPDMRILKFEEPLHENEYRTSIILKKNETALNSRKKTGRFNKVVTL